MAVHGRDGMDLSVSNYSTGNPCTAFSLSFSRRGQILNGVVGRLDLKKAGCVCFIAEWKEEGMQMTHSC